MKQTLTDKLDYYWSLDEKDVMTFLNTSSNGISDSEVTFRLNEHGYNRLKTKGSVSSISTLLGQFKSPIILILLFSAFLAFIANDNLDGLIIIGIVVSSSLLGFWQERMANNAVAKLLSIVVVKTSVLRNGILQEVATEEIVPGDVVLLSTGNIIPADSRILESDDLFINEASLTGETFPTEKQPCVVDSEAGISRRTNSIFMGTYVSSGSCKAVVVKTGKDTEFGEIAQRLAVKAPITDFELGIRRFGYLLMEMTLLFVVGIFALNVYFQRPMLDSFLFALALAVGITPQLLPTIVSLNLSKGAKQMAESKVIVKKLDAIEDFGSMNILCTDKTGTLTEGIMQIHSGVDIAGIEIDSIKKYAYLNAFFQQGYKNPIDQAILTQYKYDIEKLEKVDELPYDFVRKRLSVLLRENEEYILITKGAVNNVLDCCTYVQKADDQIIEIKDEMDNIYRKYEIFSNQGFRTIAVAYKKLGVPERITRENEIGLTLVGFLLLYDPPKKGIDVTISKLKELGIQLKIITGDNKLVAAQVGTQIGFNEPKIVSGGEIRQINDEALIIKVRKIDIFAEIEPNQKERIILALRKSGNVVGYLGDGINDASALHAADVGISVENAADVAKEAAEFVLLEKDLDVLVDGVIAGRRTFANTIKYILITMSANFGNMLSMAGASLLLPFLPLLPKQILGINFITDFPAMTIASDDVDSELVQRPRRWNLNFIIKFMLVFGTLSTLFDFISFGVLLYVGSFQPEMFRTGWFTISVITEILVMLIIRTRRPFYKSKPSRPLMLSSIVVLLIALVLPYSLLGALLSFIPLSVPLLGALVGIVFAYLILNETVKAYFYRRIDS